MLNANLCVYILYACLLDDDANNLKKYQYRLCYRHHCYGADLWYFKR